MEYLHVCVNLNKKIMGAIPKFKQMQFLDDQVKMKFSKRLKNCSLNKAP